MSVVRDAERSARAAASTGTTVSCENGVMT